MTTPPKKYGRGAIGRLFFIGFGYVGSLLLALLMVTVALVLLPIEFISSRVE